MSRITISSRLFSILAPLVFLGSCTVAHPFVWDWRESKRIREPATEGDKRNFPLLARTPEAKYVIFRREAPKDAEIVRSVSSRDSDRINRDLREWRGVQDDYPYFKILKEDGVSYEISLEVPNTDEYVIRGTYVLKDGQITSQRLLITFGPGLALIESPWLIAPGFIGLIVFYAVFRRGKKTSNASEPVAEGPGVNVEVAPKKSNDQPPSPTR